MTAKRLTIEFDGHRYFSVIDKVYERCIARLDTKMDAIAWLEIYKMLSEENEKLKKENEQLKQQLMELQNDFNNSENDSTKSRNDREKSCGYCKNYNLDGMFGIWCSIHETPTYDKYCQDFEWNR